MNALDIMKALRDLPDDLIDACFADAPAGAAASEHPKGMPNSAGRRRREARAFPRLLTGTVLAACLLFAVGFGGFMLHEMHENTPQQKTVQEHASQPETTIPQQTETAVTVTSVTETTAAAVVYAELELHEPTDQTPNYETMNAAREKYAQNGPAIIDTQKYIRMYFSEGTEGDLNSPEAKSYLYHMMLNSIDYYQSAEGEMVYGLDAGRIELLFQTDHAAGLSYELQRQSETALTESYYSAASHRQYTVDLLSRQYRESVCSDQESDFVLSDNARCVKQSDGTMLTIRRSEPTFLPISGSSLFPQDYAMSRLYDFDSWDISGTEERLGFQCAVIDGTIGSRTFRMWIDVSTGIMLRFEEYYANGNLQNLVDVTALKINQPVEVRQFDPNSWSYTS